MKLIGILLITLGIAVSASPIFQVCTYYNGHKITESCSGDCSDTCTWLDYEYAQCDFNPTST